MGESILSKENDPIVWGDLMTYTLPPRLFRPSEERSEKLMGSQS